MQPSLACALPFSGGKDDLWIEALLRPGQVAPEVHEEQRRERSTTHREDHPEMSETVLTDAWSRGEIVRY
jgi:hypothetical protein